MPGLNEKVESGSVCTKIRLSSFATYGSCQDIKVVGDYAYLTLDNVIPSMAEEGLHIYDISNPSSPSLLNSYQLSNPINVYIADNQAVVVHLSGFTVLDISIPATPQFLSSYWEVDGSLIGGGFVQNGYGYLINLEKGMRIVSFSTPEEDPTEVGLYKTMGAIQNVHISGNYAYATGRHSGLWIIDVTDLYKPQVISNFDLAPHLTDEVVVDGNYAYVADIGLTIIDVTNPISPTEVNSIFSNCCDHVFVDGNYAYTLGGQPAFRVIDISDPATPVWVSSFDIQGDPSNFVFDGDFVYIPNNTTKELLIIDISDPMNPAEVTSYPLSIQGLPEGLFVIDQKLFISVLYDGLYILDISEPTNPVELGHSSLIASDNIFVLNNYLFDPGIIWDISDPTNIEFVTATGCGGRIDISNEIVFSAGENTGFEICGDAPMTCNDLNDTDGDALPNGWEVCGYDHDGDGVIDVDLPAMGADPLHNDIFLEIDYMVDDGWCMLGICTAGHTHKPKHNAISMLVAAFDNSPVSNPDGTTGIHLHVDYGSDALLYGGDSSTWGGLSKSDELVHKTPFSLDGWNDTEWPRFDNIKQLDVAREPIFHYLIMMHSLDWAGTKGISRNFDGYENDVLFRQGSSDFAVGLHNASALEEAGIIMHELGHNLGLRHGGDDHTYFEPNYLSVMNYSFAEFGLILAEHDGYLDYSRFSTSIIPLLNENELDETAGLGDASEIGNYGTRYYCGFFNSRKKVLHVNIPIDWDCSGEPDNTQTSEDINKDGDWTENIQGTNDWDMIVFDGGCIGGPGNTSAHLCQNSVPQSQFLGMNSLSINTIEESFPNIQPEYSVELTQSGFYALEKNIQATLPFTITNIGYMTATVAITVTADSWIDAGSIPGELVLVPDEIVTFTIGINADNLGSGVIGSFEISTGILESPRMVNEATLIFRVGPKARYTDYTEEEYPPNEFLFTDLSVGRIDSWVWDFGDTMSSGEQNPIHKYSTPGTYTVILTVSGPDGSDTYTHTITVSMNRLFLPVVVK